MALAIPYFVELQRRLFDIFRYASCHESNFDTFSIMLESLLVDTCSFFDSLCQTFIREKEKAGHAFKEQAKIRDFGKKVTGADDFSFADYRTLLEGDLILSKKEVNLNAYEYAPYAIPMPHNPTPALTGFPVAPFKEWATGASSPWWKAFTDLKHDRLSNFREAKLRHVIYSLAGVFIILSLHHELEFKKSMKPELFDLFTPKYWSFAGRMMPGIVIWDD